MIRGKNIDKIKPLHTNNHKELKYFSIVNITKTYELDGEYQKIKKVISCITDYDIILIRLGETAFGSNNEGHNFTGIKIIVDLQIKQKIMGIESNSDCPIIKEVSFYYSAPIILPKYINGVAIRKLLNKNKIGAEIIQEYDSCDITNFHQITSNILFIINVFF